MTDAPASSEPAATEPAVLDPKNISDWTDIGPDAPRAIWRFDGTLRVTTSDDQAAGSDPHRA